jgi:hypothetical protein
MQEAAHASERGESILRAIYTPSSCSETVFSAMPKLIGVTEAWLKPRGRAEEDYLAVPGGLSEKNFYK